MDYGWMEPKTKCSRPTTVLLLMEALKKQTASNKHLRCKRFLFDITKVKHSSVKLLHFSLGNNLVAVRLVSAVVINSFCRLSFSFYFVVISSGVFCFSYNHSNANSDISFMEIF